MQPPGWKDLDEAHDANEREALNGAINPHPVPHQDAEFTILDGADLGADLPPLEYLVKDIFLVADGGAPHLIAGYGFSGKTVAMQAMALQLVSGRAIWGAYLGHKPKRVLHVDLEQGDRLTRRRYQRIARSMSLDLTEMGNSIGALVLPKLALRIEHAAAWEKLMTKRDMVIIDSLRAASPGLDENSSDIRGGLDMLTAISEHTGCRAVVIHHARKTGKDDMDVRFAIRGSSAIFDACDSVYIFSGQKGEAVTVENIKARTNGDLCENFSLSIEDELLDGDPKGGLKVQVHGAELVSEQRSARKKADADKQASIDAAALRKAIGAHPGAQTTQLRGLLAMPGNRFAAALLLLGAEVEVREERRGTKGPLSRCHYLNAG